MVTPGRFYALCVTPATLIRTSHGYRGTELEALLPDGLPRRGGRAPIRGEFGVVGSLGAEDGLRVRGGPDWVRKERYTIEAVASGTPDAATMSGPMLRALFARRFKLKTHARPNRRPRTTSSWLRAVSDRARGPRSVRDARRQAGRAAAQRNAARDAAQFADVRRGQKPTCGVWGGANGPNWVSVAGEATLGQLTQMLRGRLVRGIGVTDKTGITDKFNWDLEYVVDGNASNAPTALLLDGGCRRRPRAPTIFDALEQQLGLRLEPVQVPRKYLVIDAIERPGPN